MRKCRRALTVALLFCLCTSAWASLHVSGDVHGVWPSGDSVFVDGPTRVPGGKGLLIEPGVVVVFKSADRFEVEGVLEARGTSTSPIILVPVEGWSGFYFAPNDRQIQALYYVIIPDDAPTPLHVIMTQDAMLEVSNCILRAWRSCLNIDSGRVWASQNYLLVQGVYGYTVRIHNLRNDLSRCIDPFGNRLTGNIIKAEVAAAVDPLPPSSEFTSGLYIDGSTNLCLWDNTVSVIAPGSTIAAYFGQMQQGDGGISELDSCVISAKSYNGPPKGVFNANEGRLRVRRCVVDVAEVNADNLSRSAGILASHQAEVVVNSSIVAVDRDTLWFVSVSGGRLSVDYATRWSSSASSISDGYSRNGYVDLLDGGGDPATSVTYGNHVYTADPLLLRQGEWGAWRTPDSVAAYYGIQEGSPCVDSGDSLFGNDPDNTPPDIGRFYYPQTNAHSGGLPGVLPVTIMLAPAFPNPFNSVTVIPLAVDRRGEVSMVVYDIQGRVVTSLISRWVDAGHYNLRFGADGLASGTYLVRLLVNGQYTGSERLVLIR